MEDIYDRYKDLFTSDDGEPAFYYSDELYDVEALRRRLWIGGVKGRDRTVIELALKAWSRYNEDVHKVQSIEGDYELMALEFRKTTMNQVLSAWTSLGGNLWEKGEEEIPLELTLSEFDNLVNSLEYCADPKERYGDHVALTYWDEGNEAEAVRLAKVLSPQRERLVEQGLQSLYDFLC